MSISAINHFQRMPTHALPAGTDRTNDGQTTEERLRSAPTPLSLLLDDGESPTGGAGAAIGTRSVSGANGSGFDESLTTLSETEVMTLAALISVGEEGLSGDYVNIIKSVGKLVANPNSATALQVGKSVFGFMDNMRISAGFIGEDGYENAVKYIESLGDGNQLTSASKALLEEAKHDIKATEDYRANQDESSHETLEAQLNNKSPQVHAYLYLDTKRQELLDTLGQAIKASEESQRIAQEVGAAEQKELDSLDLVDPEYADKQQAIIEKYQPLKDQWATHADLASNYLHSILGDMDNSGMLKYIMGETPATDEILGTNLKLGKLQEQIADEAELVAPIVGDVDAYNNPPPQGTEFGEFDPATWGGGAGSPGSAYGNDYVDPGVPANNPGEFPAPSSSSPLPPSLADDTAGPSENTGPNTPNGPNPNGPNPDGESGVADPGRPPETEDDPADDCPSTPSTTPGELDTVNVCG